MAQLRSEEAHDLFHPLAARAFDEHPVAAAARRPRARPRWRRDRRHVDRVGRHARGGAGRGLAREVAVQIERGEAERAGEPRRRRDAARRSPPRARACRRARRSGASPALPRDCGAPPPSTRGWRCSCRRRPSRRSRAPPPACGSRPAPPPARPARDRLGRDADRPRRGRGGERVQRRCGGRESAAARRPRSPPRRRRNDAAPRASHVTRVGRRRRRPRRSARRDPETRRRAPSRADPRRSRPRSPSAACAAKSSPLARATPSIEPSPSRCAGPTLVMTPTSGSAISVSRRISPGAFIPISITAWRSVAGETEQA